MKSAIAIATVIAVILCSHSLCPASDEQGERSTEGKLRIFIVESNLEKLQQTLTGMIIRRGTRLMIATSRGPYLLKGLNLEENVGRRMEVRGLMQQENREKCMYVIKAFISE